MFKGTMQNYVGVGYCGQDPVSIGKNDAGETIVAQVDICIKSQWVDKYTQEKKVKEVWVPCRIFGANRCEHLMRNVKKGPKAISVRCAG